MQQIVGGPDVVGWVPFSLETEAQDARNPIPISVRIQASEGGVGSFGPQARRKVIQ